MTVGVLLLHLHLPGNQSLKGKRGVIKSLMARVQQRYNVSVAEVGKQDLWQSAEIGVSCVSNSEPHARELLERVLRFVEGERLDVDVVDYEMDVLRVL
jgi:uncharacterized protein YlxP (DUF503 family)